MSKRWITHADIEAKQSSPEVIAARNAEFERRRLALLGEAPAPTPKITLDSRVSGDYRGVAQPNPREQGATGSRPPRGDVFDRVKRERRLEIREAEVAAIKERIDSRTIKTVQELQAERKAYRRKKRKLKKQQRKQREAERMVKCTMRGIQTFSPHAGRKAGAMVTASELNWKQEQAGANDAAQRVARL